jgi:hypothetical protein
MRVSQAVRIWMEYQRCNSIKPLTLAESGYFFSGLFPGMMTIGYLHFHPRWDTLNYGCIGSPFLSFHGTYPGEEPILFLLREEEP